MSKNDGVTLTISGAVNGDPANPAPDLQIVGYEKIEFTQPLGARLGSLVKYGPGDYVTSANSAYAGPTLLVNGRTLVTDLSSGGQPSSLGNASSAPANLVFTPRFKHTDENYRPALVYSGPAATCDRGFTLADAADAIIESSGTGALTLTGAVVLKPGATYTPTLTLGGSNTAANTFAVTIDPVNSSTTKLNVTKRDAGSWALGTAWLQTGSLTIDGGAYDLNGFNSTQGAVVVNAGALRNSAANAAQLDCASFNLKTGATLQLHADYSAGTVSADRVKATGTVTLAGSLVFVPGSSLPVGAKVTLVESAGSALIVGTFAGRAEGSTFTASGQSWKITYRGGTGSNDVVLTRML